MKKLSIVCLLLLSATAFSQDMLSFIKGKWKIDVEATKKQPQVKKMLADEQKAQMMNMMLGMLGQAEFEFKKDALATTMMGKTDEDKFTVVENKKDKLIIQNKNKEKLLITKKDKAIVLQEMPDKKPAGDDGMPPLVMKKMK